MRKNKIVIRNYIKIEEVMNKDVDISKFRFVNKEKMMIVDIDHLIREITKYKKSNFEI